MSESAPKKKKSVRSKKARTNLYIMNVSKHSFWTGSGRVDVGQLAECDSGVAAQLVAAGLAQIYKEGEWIEEEVKQGDE